MSDPRSERKRRRGEFWLLVGYITMHITQFWYECFYVTNERPKRFIKFHTKWLYFLIHRVFQFSDSERKKYLMIIMIKWYFNAIQKVIIFVEAFITTNADHLHWSIHHQRWNQYYTTYIKYIFGYHVSHFQNSFLLSVIYMMYTALRDTYCNHRIRVLRPTFFCAKSIKVMNISFIEFLFWTCNLFLKLIQLSVKNIKL